MLSTARIDAPPATSDAKYAEYLRAVMEHQPESARRLWWEYIDLVTAEMAAKKTRVKA